MSPGEADGREGPFRDQLRSLIGQPEPEKFQAKLASVLLFSRRLSFQKLCPFVPLCPVPRQGKAGSGIAWGAGVDTRVPGILLGTQTQPLAQVQAGLQPSSSRGETTSRGTPTDSPCLPPA